MEFIVGHNTFIVETVGAQIAESLISQQDTDALIVQLLNAALELAPASANDDIVVAISAALEASNGRP